MRWGAFFYPHEVTLEPHRQGGGMGGGLGAPVARPAEVRDEQRIVLDTAGAERVSNTQVTVALEHAVAPESYATVWQGTPLERRARVIAIGPADNRDTRYLDSTVVLHLE